VAVSAIREFLKHESAGGLILVAVAILALILDNTSLAWLYDSLLNFPVAVRFGALEIAKTLLLWINDGLMAVFFLLVALEIKREVLEGELSSLERASLPAIAAVGGMAVPAAIYMLVAGGDAVAARGWAIPAATDIAFALGILLLLGKRVPLALKIFLLALAIIDDLGAILIIAAFYTADLSYVSLGLAGLGAAALFALNRFGVLRVAAYILVGIFVWVCVLKSGVHATLAGVLVGFAVPLGARRAGDIAPAGAGAQTSSLGCFRHYAGLRLCECRRASRRRRLLESRRTDHSGRRARPAHGQATRDHYLRLAGGAPAPVSAARRNRLVPDIRRGVSGGHWVHDEPVHRDLGL